MFKIILQILVSLPLVGVCQDVGINFEQGLSWKEIQEKAKSEKKHIFVDCYATWCGPCKAMDNEIYSSATVGDAFNHKFVSVRLQMDRTGKDGSEIKAWYRDADRIASDYTITAYPTFLFFTADGKPLHKVVGFKNEASFIELGNDALNPSKQYYSLLSDYKPGILDTSEMKGLALAYKRSGIELSEKIVVDYLNRVPASEKFNESNLRFLSEFTSSQGLQALAFDYLKGLSKNQFSDVKNIRFAVAFSNNKNIKVQELCFNYFKSLTRREFGDTLNLKFAAVYGRGQFPEMQTLAVNYLQGLNRTELQQRQNIVFATAYARNERVQTVVNRYIGKLSKKCLREKYMIEFIKEFTVNSRCPGFKLLYANEYKVNDLMNNRSYVQTKIDFIIRKELIDTVIKRALISHSLVNWDSLNKIISRKYDYNTSDRIILATKVQWYLVNEDWPLYLSSAIEQVNKYGPAGHVLGPDAALNELAWYGIFMHSTDTAEICLGIQWLEEILVRQPSNPFYLDTYANLLYKIGRISEALNFELKAITLNSKDMSVQEAYEKMQKGIPTWKK